MSVLATQLRASNAELHPKRGKHSEDYVRDMAAYLAGLPFQGGPGAPTMLQPSLGSGEHLIVSNFPHLPAEHVALSTGSSGDDENASSLSPWQKWCAENATHMMMVHLISSTTYANREELLELIGVIAVFLDDLGTRVAAEKDTRLTFDDMRDQLDALPPGTIANLLEAGRNGLPEASRASVDRYVAFIVTDPACSDYLQERRINAYSTNPDFPVGIEAMRVDPYQEWDFEDAMSAESLQELFFRMLADNLDRHLEEGTNLDTLDREDLTRFYVVRAVVVGQIMEDMRAGTIPDEGRPVSYASAQEYHGNQNREEMGAEFRRAVGENREHLEALAQHVEEEGVYEKVRLRLEGSDGPANFKGLSEADKIDTDTEYAPDWPEVRRWVTGDLVTKATPHPVGDKLVSPALSDADRDSGEMITVAAPKLPTKLITPAVNDAGTPITLMKTKSRRGNAQEVAPSTFRSLLSPSAIHQAARAILPVALLEGMRRIAQNPQALVRAVDKGLGRGTFIGAFMGVLNTETQEVT